MNNNRRWYWQGVIFLALCCLMSSLGAQNICEWRAGYQKYRDEHRVLWTKYGSYQSCFSENAAASPANDVGGCNFFVARVLVDAGIAGLKYQKNDPRGGPEGAYLVANALAKELFARSGPTGEFELLGNATSTEANASAQQRANGGKLVVAVLDASPNQGHIALVIPGQQSDSASWAPLRPPMSASWFINRPENAYVGCPLSSAFAKPDAVRLYATK